MTLSFDAIDDRELDGHLVDALDSLHLGAPTALPHAYDRGLASSALPARLPLIGVFVLLATTNPRI